MTQTLVRSMRKIAIWCVLSGRAPKKQSPYKPILGHPKLISKSGCSRIGMGFIPIWGPTYVLRYCFFLLYFLLVLWNSFCPSPRQNCPPNHKQCLVAYCTIFFGGYCIFLFWLGCFFGKLSSNPVLCPSLWYELRVASRAFFSITTRNSAVRTVKTSCK